MREYLRVAQDQHHVEQYTRQADGRWMLWETYDERDTVKLESIGCELKLQDIYAKVQLPPLSEDV